MDKKTIACLMLNGVSLKSNAISGKDLPLKLGGLGGQMWLAMPKDVVILCDTFLH